MNEEQQQEKCYCEINSIQRNDKNEMDEKRVNDLQNFKHNPIIIFWVSRKKQYFFFLH